ncbi:reverse transcriptase [Tanacetum coccineum]
MFIEIILDDDESRKEGPNEGEGAATEESVVEYFDTLPTRDELTYHRYLRKLDPRENANGGISNFTRRIKGMHVFVGNFTYVVDFMIVEDISSIIDPSSPTTSVLHGRFPKIAFVEHASSCNDEAGGKVDLHLNLPVLEVLAYAPIYNAILYKYIESLELGKNGSAFVQGEIPAKMKDPGLFTLPCRLGDSKPFDTLADLGSCVNIIPLYLFKKFNIELLEETDHIFGLADGTKSYPVRIVKDAEVYIGKLKLLNDFYVIDMKKDPETLASREWIT